MVPTGGLAASSRKCGTKVVGDWNSYRSMACRVRSPVTSSTPSRYATHGVEESASCTASHTGLPHCWYENGPAAVESSSTELAYAVPPRHTTSHERGARAGLCTVEPSGGGTWSAYDCSDVMHCTREAVAFTTWHGAPLMSTDVSTPTPPRLLPLIVSSCPPRTLPRCALMALMRGTTCTVCRTPDGDMRWV